jgi:hypothetical protein
MIQKAMSENQGYKAFNSTGREDSTTEIIRPKGGAQRTAIFVAVIVLFVLGLCYFGFVQTGMNPFNPPQEQGHGFNPGKRDIAKPSE